MYGELFIVCVFIIWSSRSICISSTAASLKVSESLQGKNRKKINKGKRTQQQSWKFCCFWVILLLHFKKLKFDERKTFSHSNISIIFPFHNKNESKKETNTYVYMIYLISLSKTFPRSISAICLSIFFTFSFQSTVILFLFQMLIFPFRDFYFEKRKFVFSIFVRKNLQSV